MDTQKPVGSASDQSQFVSPSSGREWDIMASRTIRLSGRSWLTALVLERMEGDFTGALDLHIELPSLLKFDPDYSVSATTDGKIRLVGITSDLCRELGAALIALTEHPEAAEMLEESEVKMASWLAKSGVQLH